MTRSERCRRGTWRISGCYLAVLLAVLGCGGGAVGHPPASTVSPPEGPPTPVPNPGVFNVTVTTRGGQFLLDALECEINRRRGIYGFFGFHSNAYRDPVMVPFQDIARVEFRGMMPTELFEQAMIGREALNLSPDVAFEVLLTLRDQRQELFYAFIPKIRGNFDFKPWEAGMTNNALGIQLIEFNR